MSFSYGKSVCACVKSKKNINKATTIVASQAENHSGFVFLSIIFFILGAVFISACTALSNDRPRRHSINFPDILLVMVLNMSPYIPDLVRLCSLHSIWQFSAVVLPSLCQGVMWSASISSISHFCFSSFSFLHHGQTLFCRSYASRFILSVKARIFKNFSFLVKTYSYIPDFLVTSSFCINSVISFSCFFESNFLSLN